MIDVNEIYKFTVTQHRVANLTHDIGVCDEYMNVLFKCRLFRDEGLNQFIHHIIRKLDDEKIKMTDELNKTKLKEVL